MIKAVLFDLDGTLIDSNELHVAAWSRVFAEAGHTIDDAAIQAQIGKGGDNLVPALLPQLPRSDRQRLADAHGELFKREYLKRARPFPGARDLLERVYAAGRKVVLASSASKAELEHYARLLAVKDIVSEAITIDDVDTSKPAPDIFAMALKRTNVAAGEAIAVGDTIYDVQAARNAGIGTVALCSGPFTAAELGAAGAVAVYDDVADLLRQFDGSPLAR